MITIIAAMNDATPTLSWASVITAAIPPAITAILTFLTLEYRPRQTQRLIPVDAATTKFHSVFNISRKPIKVKELYFTAFITRVQIIAWVITGILFFIIVALFALSLVFNAFLGGIGVSVAWLGLLMLVVGIISWPLYLHRLDEDTESKFRFFKKICVHYKRNYEDIKRNTLTALELLNYSWHDFTENENSPTRSIEFEIHFEIREEEFIATVKEVNPDKTTLEIRIVSTDIGTKITKFKSDETGNGVKTFLVKFVNPIHIKRGLSIVGQIRKRSLLINQFVNVALIDLTQEKPSGKMPSDQSTDTPKSAIMPDGSIYP